MSSCVDFAIEWKRILEKKKINKKLSHS
eukprot:SAG31_NODE_32507_length_355_cov_0.667969_1_plen_27_part_10